MFSPKKPGYVSLGTLVLALFAIVIPVLVSGDFARRQTLSTQVEQVEAVSLDLLRRTDTTIRQIDNAREVLSKSQVEPCSEDDLRTMRSLVMTSDYLQATGRMEGNKLICGSFGTLPAPIDLGAETMSPGKHGRRLWRSISIPFTGDARFHVVERGGVCAFIAEGLVLDAFGRGPEMDTGVLATFDEEVISSTGPVDPREVKKLGDRNAVTHVDDRAITAIRRSNLAEVAVIASLPTSYIRQRETKAALLFVPMGALVSLLLGITVIRSGQRQQTLPFVLRQAIRQKEFFMNYQPIVDLRTGSVVAAEALIRWRRPTGEMVRPDLFIPVAEETGLMPKITEIVIDLVMHDAARILARDPNFRLNLNFSSKDIQTGNAVDQLVRVAALHRVSLSSLTVEITETGLLSGERSLQAVQTLRRAGVKIAMDDFGSGYSSVANLMTLDVDCLKVDKLFVDSIGRESATSQVIVHIIEMARSLQISVTAEGVENLDQVAYLREHGVQYGQGFMFGRPMPIDALLATVSSARTSD
jgi:sensor c-di-GMP phosphodiesterase-like protein